MKRLFVCVLSLFAVVAVAEAQSRLEHLTVKSEILGVEKFRQGDSSESAARPRTISESSLRLGS